MLWEKARILRAHRTKEISISPFSAHCCKSHSYVLRLGGVWNCLDADDKRQLTEVDPFALDRLRAMVTQYRKKTLSLEPRALVLNASHEQVRLPNDVGGFLTPLGQLSRLGLVNFSSPYLHPGFGGRVGLPVVFEFFHTLPCRLRLYEGMPFAHLHFFSVSPGRGKSESAARRDVMDGFLGCLYDKMSAYRKATLAATQEIVRHRRFR